MDVVYMHKQNNNVACQSTVMFYIPPKNIAQYVQLKITPL